MPTWHANFLQVWLVKPKSDGCRIWKLGRSIVIINISMIMIMVIICIHTLLGLPWLGLAWLATGTRPRRRQLQWQLCSPCLASNLLGAFRLMCSTHTHAHTHTIPYSQFALLILCCSWCEVLVYTPRVKFVNLPCQRVLAMLPCGPLYMYKYSGLN